MRARDVELRLLKDCWANKPDPRSPIMFGADEATLLAPAGEAWPKSVEGGVAAAFGCSAWGWAPG